MIFKVDSASGHPLYLQLMQQIRHGIETGLLRHDDPLPSIRALAQKLVVSHNTVAKAYSELEHEELINLRHGSGAYVSAKRKVRLRAERVHRAKERVAHLVAKLQAEGFSDDEIRRLFEAALLYQERLEVA
jgi:GntR family transcriptional regulator